MIFIMEIKFTSLVFKEKDMYVAFCPELDVSSCGREVDEARRNLFEAVNIFLEETNRLGSLEDVLREAGYALKDRKRGFWVSPDLVMTEQRDLSFPSGG